MTERKEIHIFVHFFPHVWRFTRESCTARISFKSQSCIRVWDLTLNSAAWHSGQTAPALFTTTFLIVTCYSILQAQKILIIRSARETVGSSERVARMSAPNFSPMDMQNKNDSSCTAPPIYASSFHTLLQTGISFSDVKFKPWFGHVPFPQLGMKSMAASK